MNRPTCCVRFVCLLAVTVLLPAFGRAGELKLPAVFGSHMVLQRGMPLPVWGWADPQEEITVSFRDQSRSTVTDADGRWMLKLEPEDVGRPGVLTVSGRGRSVSLDDVLVGEVWVCSGQSNMQWAVQAAIDPDLEAAAAHHPRLRLFQVPLVSESEPQEDVAASWRVCASDNVSTFTAVGYYFGRTLQSVLQVPVGLIQTAWGGTRAEAWTSPDKMAALSELQPILTTWQDSVARFEPDQAQRDYEQALSRWRERAREARAAGRPAPGQRPQPPTSPRLSQHHPSNLFNAMVAPLTPFAIRGAIWYQGESNAGRAYQYRTLMPAMIESWREDWQQGDFPFYMVQLANFREIQSEPSDSDWAELREAQMLTTQALPNVGVACITDLGAAKDIHPKNKQDVGRRLARLALVDVYGEDGLARNGPVFKSVEFTDSKALVHFDNGGSDLISWYGEPLTGFAVASEPGAWHWATAQIVDGDTVELSCAEVPTPKAVRYNWADNPQGNLYNGRYLPAYPFRTDDWPGVTLGKVTP
jgi:sialate O-acetylesterase